MGEPTNDRYKVVRNEIFDLLTRYQGDSGFLVIHAIVDVSLNITRFLMRGEDTDIIDEIRDEVIDMYKISINHVKEMAKEEKKNG